MLLKNFIVCIEVLNDYVNIFYAHIILRYNDYVCQFCIPTTFVYTDTYPIL